MQPLQCPRQPQWDPGQSAAVCCWCVCLDTVVAEIYCDRGALLAAAQSFFGQGSQVWLSLVSDGCLHCHHKMAPALHCDVCVGVCVCVWVMRSDRRSCVCICYKCVCASVGLCVSLCVNLGVWLVKVVCTHASVWVCSTMCVWCCRLSLFKPSPYSSNPLIPIIPFSPSSFFLLPPPSFLLFPSCLPLLSYLFTSLCVSFIS